MWEIICLFFSFLSVNLFVSPKEPHAVPTNHFKSVFLQVISVSMYLLCTTAAFVTLTCVLLCLYCKQNLRVYYCRFWFANLGFQRVLFHHVLASAEPFLWDILLSQLTSSQFVYCFHGAGFYMQTLPQYSPSPLQDYKCNRLSFLSCILEACF